MKLKVINKMLALINIVRDPNTSISEHDKAIIKIEEMCISRERCPQDKVMRIRKRLYNLDIEKLEILPTSKNNFNKEIGCIVDAITFTQDPSLRRIDRFRIKEWFSNLRIIGTPSKNGIVMMSPQLNQFVIKENVERDDLIHEAAAGFLVTNKLRNYIPNFMYVYSIFDCGPTVSLDGTKVSGWCGQDLSQLHLVLENVKDSIPVSKFIQSCTLNEFRDIFLQIVNAMNIAYKANKFLHNDLHDGNVLVRKLVNPIPIMYSGRNKAKIISSQNIATIIDFGSCTFEASPEEGQKPILFTFRRLSGYTFPLNDISYFITICLRDSTNPEITGELLRLSRFYDKDNIERFNSLTFEDYLEWYVATTSLPTLQDGTYPPPSNEAEDLRYMFVRKVPRNMMDYCNSSTMELDPEKEFRNLVPGIKDIIRDLTQEYPFPDIISMDKLCKYVNGENPLTLEDNDKILELGDRIYSLRDKLDDVLVFANSSTCALKKAGKFSKYKDALDTLNNWIRDTRERYHFLFQRLAILVYLREISNN